MRLPLLLSVAYLPVLISLPIRTRLRHTRIAAVSFARIQMLRATTRLRNAMTAMSKIYPKRSFLSYIFSLGETLAVENFKLDNLQKFCSLNLNQ